MHNVRCWLPDLLSFLICSPLSSSLLRNRIIYFIICSFAQEYSGFNSCIRRGFLISHAPPWLATFCLSKLLCFKGLINSMWLERDSLERNIPFLLLSSPARAWVTSGREILHFKNVNIGTLCILEFSLKLYMNYLFY